MYVLNNCITVPSNVFDQTVGQVSYSYVRSFVFKCNTYTEVSLPLVLCNNSCCYALAHAKLNHSRVSLVFPETNDVTFQFAWIFIK